MLRVRQRTALKNDALNVMNFLNEVTLWYPSAISFAPGRPAEQYFDVRAGLTHLEGYVAQLADQKRIPAEVGLTQLGQYQKTNGIINDLICRFLATDEQIHVSPQAVMVTDGAQEGMAILAAGLFDPAEDVLLVSDPTYIGMTGISAILGIELCPVPQSADGPDLDALAQNIEQLHRRGKTPKALYIIPDFNNPLGSSMSIAAKRRLLDLAYTRELLIIEDNPYGMFAYDADRAPTLKSLDTQGVVIYLGTFSKILFPALRVGFLVADQEMLTDDSAAPVCLAQELSKVKSLTSVNTSALLQGIVGGTLLSTGGSLAGIVASKIPFYRANRDLMLACLDHHFNHDPLLAGAASWSRPGGGFFLTITLPFAFTQGMLKQCAEHYGVICCPMSFFSLLPGCENQIRLSFSYVSQGEIEQGVACLHQFIHDTWRAQHTDA